MGRCSLQNLLFTLCIPLSCVRSAAGLIHVSGYVGGQVNISCQYEWGYESYEKYLCKNPCDDYHVLIKTTEPNKVKYSIHDDEQQRVFTAKISDLSLTDAGQYWCGVTRTGKDIYFEVKLDVGKDNCCNKVTKAKSYEESSVSISCPYELKYQNNLKYMCRGTQPSMCLEQALITSENKQNGQFNLTDDKESRKFTVNIARLTKENSGRYLCGVHQNTELDVFTAVELEVNAWCCVNSTNQSGIMGHPVTLKCPYPPQHRNNRKFLCKGEHRNNCTDVVTDHSTFTLKDDVPSSSFSAVIRKLKAGDAGTYWCGSHAQWRVANYTVIHLSVVFPQDTSSVNPTTHTIHTTTQPTKIFRIQVVVYIVTAVVLTVTCLIVVIVYKCKYYKVRGDGAKITEGEIHLPEIYANQAVPCSKPESSKLHSVCQHYDDTDVAEQDSVYQNYSTDAIYTNEIEIRGNRR